MEPSTNTIGTKNNFLVFFIRILIKRKFPFKYRVFLILGRLGLLNCNVGFRMEFGEFSVPADQWDFWKINGPENYARRRLEYLSSIIRDKCSFCHFVDLGADVGAVSLGIFRRLREKISKITAVEPNPKSFPILEQNLKAFPVETSLHNKAVGSENCQVELIYDQLKSSDHSGYVEKSRSGSTEMVTLDSLLSQHHEDSADSLILKIDVEGQEKFVFLGGKEAILSYRNVIIFLEIMPKVLERENSSAEDIFQTVENIRKFDWVLSDHPYTKIDRNKRFSEQFGTDKQRDVIGISIE